MDREPLNEASQGSVMFADLSGSTRLYEVAGNAAAMAAVARCLGVMRSCSQDCGGRIVKTIGDEIMVVFPAAERALQAALDMQHAVAELPPVAGVPMSIHIGFHHGPVLSDIAGDVFGDTVNLAARLSKLASRGQIITSAESVGGLPDWLRRTTRYLYPIQVRGREQPVELFEAIWQQATDLTLIDTESPRTACSVFLTLRYRSALVEMNLASAPVTIGRDSTMTIVVADRRASRFQATVESRAGRYVLVDRSSNGTHVTIDGEESFILRRDDVMLRSHGWITFGQSMEGVDEGVEFFVRVERV
ncbi:adenylate/guanylate cyclase domain-containing protein [Cupriavidus pinatubonensis]